MTKTEPDSGNAVEMLRTKWTTLYHTTLPTLAKSRNPAQASWPVTLDHCFARIILDNTIGKSGGSKGEDLQWDKVIQKPAVRNMTEEHLRLAIELGERIARGDVELVELDQWSLDVRGKTKGKRKSESPSEKQENPQESTKKRKVQQDHGQYTDAQEESVSRKEPQGKNRSGKKQTQSTLSFQSSSSTSTSTHAADVSSGKTTVITSKNTPDISDDSHISGDTILRTLHKIQTHPGLTPFRRRLYTSLLSVPTGQHTTYAALATHLGSVPRAVGNGMRNNPFAPTVPCHRVLASDGTLGGFFGDWGTEGKYGGEKINLLKGEGVTFTSSGKVKGMVWSNFWDMGEFEREYGKVM